MTDWLARLFVKNYENVENSAVRSAYGTFASIVCILCNVVLCAAKGVIGFVSGSVSIVADAMNNLSDASSNIISLFGFKLASKPADADHPYGHGRFEYLSGLAVAALIVVIGIELIRSSIDKILAPSPAEFNAVVAAVLVLSILVKLWMAFFNRRIGKRISSTTLIATAVDSRNDVIATAAVLAAAIVSSVTGVDLDGWAGLAVGAFIVYSGVTLLRDTIDPLLGKAPDPEFVKHIHDKIMSYPGVVGTHDLMVHDYGPGRRFASAHVEMPASIDPMESHDVIDNIEEAFRAEDDLLMVLHYDPIATDDSAVGDMRAWISRNVKRVDERLTIHDLRIVPGPTHTNVIFDVVRPVEFDMADAELKQRVSAVVREHRPDAICKITVDVSYVSAK